MPIKFRCAYCNQLMGIARRKAGTVVRCPTCAGQVVVPMPEGPPEVEAEEGSPPPPAPPAAAPDLFERSDFGAELFAGGAPGAVRGAPPRSGGFMPVPQKRPEPPPPAEFEAEPSGPALAAYPRPAAAPPGIFLTPGKVTVLAVFIVLLIGVAFFAGMLVGRS